MANVTLQQIIDEADKVQTVSPRMLPEYLLKMVDEYNGSRDKECQVDLWYRKTGGWAVGAK